MSTTNQSNQTSNSFVEALKNSGITISDENRLKERLARTVERGGDLEREFNTIFSNTKESQISFYAPHQQGNASLTKAFKDVGFDGFTWRSFLSTLKPI